MLLDDTEIKERFESPANLLNRLRTGLSTRKNPTAIPSVPPSADQIINDLDSKLVHNGLKSKAVGIINDCLDELKLRVREVQKPEKLASIAAEMRKVIGDDDNSNDDGKKQPQVIIYSPSFIKEEHFETIHVQE